MGAGIIISQQTPEMVNRYTWCRPLPDGGIEWFEPLDSGWVLTHSQPAPALLDHSHPTLGDINFTGTVSAGGNQGLTGTRTVAGHKLTFTKGILTGFEPA